MNPEPWEAYYRNGALAACPTAPDGGYDLEVRQAWVEFFSTLPAEARLLEIGAGNGAIAAIASETSVALKRGWDIVATDLAKIDPPRDVRDGVTRLAGITFLAGVDSAALPFEDGSFDAVCGHYALEYSDVPASLAEIHRVLGSGGETQFVLQHADSPLVAGARHSIREAALVFEQTEVFRRLHRLVTMHDVTPGPTGQAADGLRAAIQELKRELPEARSSGAGLILATTLDAVQQLLVARTRTGPEAAGAETDRAEAVIRASSTRLYDLASRACTAEDMRRITAQAGAAGFSQIEVMPLHHNRTNLVGWQLMMHRP